MGGLWRTGRMLSGVRSFRRGAGMELDIIRVEEVEGDLPALVTVYSPSAERYFIGDGTYADKILP